MQKGIRKLLHEKKKIPIDTIEKCIAIYVDQYDLKNVLLTPKLQEKEDKHLQKFGKPTPQFVRLVRWHTENNFSKFLSVVTKETGVTFRYNKKKAWQHQNDDFSELAYSGVTDDL